MLLALGAALSALGNVALLRSDLFLFSSWRELWGLRGLWKQKQAMSSFLVTDQGFSRG